jgi:hypothetical protein
VPVSAGLPRAALALVLAASLLGAALAGCVDARDSDHDGTLDLDDLDDDNDGMPDTFENSAGLNPRDAADAQADGDDDGLPNLAEYGNSTDPRVADSDQDGMEDGLEVSHGLNPLDAKDGALDLDGDGLTNTHEASLHTDPGLTDTDGDTISDGWEVSEGLDPTNRADGAADADGDGLDNAGESSFGSDPHVADTDGDTMPDGWEASHGLSPTAETDAGVDADGDSFDADMDGVIDAAESYDNVREYNGGTDPERSDSDGDLMTDGYEWSCGLDPADAADAGGDADGDGLPNLNESRASTLASRPDTDGDTMGDGFEVRWGFDPRNASDAALDPDLDGLNNSQEAARGGLPFNPDTDADGVEDGGDADPSRNVTVTLRIVFLNVTFASQPLESGFDPPFELSFLLTVNGVALPRVNFTFNGSGAGGGQASGLTLEFAFDPFDGAAQAALSLALFELDLPETVGVNADDTLDLDGTGDGFALDVALDLWSGQMSGDTDRGTADGAGDARPGEHDARIAFFVALGP